MTETATRDGYGTLTEPATLTFHRMLPGPIERVWSYLTESDLRRRWLASGDMDLTVGAKFTLTWRNSELTDPPSPRPDGFSAEHSMECRVLAVDPPWMLAYTFGTAGEVRFDLAQEGSEVRLTITHRRLPDRETMLKVSAGWHAHVDVLVARANGREPLPFWESWNRLHEEYKQRLGA